MVYDSSRQRVVLFGGYGFSGFEKDVWEWDGTTWLRASTALQPAVRWSHAMAYDARRQRTVLFGGESNNTGLFFDDTWEWDGSAWTLLSPSPRPSKRKGHAMAYDSQRGVVVLFGGILEVGGGSDEVWEWDGAAWTLRAKAGAWPGETSFCAMVYDSIRGRSVMFGGIDSTCGCWSQDTWELYPQYPATLTAFGTGCPGAGNIVPLLTANPNSLPWIGTTVGLVVSQILGGTVVMALGASNTTWGGIALPYDLTPLGAPGCAVRVSPDVIVTLRNQGNAALALVSVPMDATLLGASFYSQGFAQDNTIPLRVTGTNGLAATIGGR